MLRLAGFVLFLICVPAVDVRADDCLPDGSDCTTAPPRITETTKEASLLALLEALRRRSLANRRAANANRDTSFAGDINR